MRSSTERSVTLFMILLLQGNELNNEKFFINQFGIRIDVQCFKELSN
ncbi:hypothetical protein THF1C08_180099 [Vibrio jasicida]|uniref:Uncharacterized protein n=1 Tax=Vibrio jasicida TaxID=766224 RepID=A0AAU9QKB6_9VIBR|nr:hypothetical protein THF1C08_180099 [Vibrio jasicida]CAH1581929.1 hypothetical protein THF1A12_170102 [Vibrio jasicida]